MEYCHSALSRENLNKYFAYFNTTCESFPQVRPLEPSYIYLAGGFFFISFCYNFRWPRFSPLITDHIHLEDLKQLKEYPFSSQVSESIFLYIKTSPVALGFYFSVPKGYFY